MNSPGKIITIIVIVAVILIGGFYLLNSSSSIENKQVELHDANPAPVYENEVQADPVVLTPDSPNGIYRSLPDSVSQEEEVIVYLDVLLNEDSYYIIDEETPDGWVVISSSKGSTSEKGHIKLVELNGQKEKIEYVVKAPRKTGKYIFSGFYILGNNQQLAILGQNEIVVK